MLLLRSNRFLVLYYFENVASLRKGFVLYRRGGGKLLANASSRRYLASRPASGTAPSYSVSRSPYLAVFYRSCLPLLVVFLLHHRHCLVPPPWIPTLLFPFHPGNVSSIVVHSSQVRFQPAAIATSIMPVIPALVVVDFIPGRLKIFTTSLESCLPAKRRNS